MSKTLPSILPVNYMYCSRSHTNGCLEYRIFNTENMEQVLLLFSTFIFHQKIQTNYEPVGVIVNDVGLSKWPWYELRCQVDWPLVLINVLYGVRLCQNIIQHTVTSSAKVK